MENLIYILIGIAWVAYSLYSARQKAIQKQAGMPPRGPSQSSPLPIPGNQGEGKSLFDEILREFTGESRPVPQQVSQPTVPVKPKQPERVASPASQKFEEYSGYKFVTTVNPDFPRNDEDDAIKTNILSKQSIKEDSIATNFNLREAVIYSELLKPKYF